MSRQWRVEYEGALYHIMMRGNERRSIFYDDHDRLLFLTTLGEMSKRFNVEILVYVLMDNHVHLQLKTVRANLSRSMHWLGVTGVTYAVRFNRRHSRVGHLFQGRFKSILVENNDYMNRLSLYIHRNPLQAGIVSRLADYRWSSYLSYAYGRTDVDWLNQKLILSSCEGGSLKEQRRMYRTSIQNYSEEEASFLEDSRFGFIVGSKEFVAAIRVRFSPGKKDPELPSLGVMERIRLDDPTELLETAAAHLGCDLQAMQNCRRIPAGLRDERDLLLYFLWSKGLWNNQEIGDLFGLTYSTVSRRVGIVHSNIATNSSLKKKLHDINH